MSLKELEVSERSGFCACGCGGKTTIPAKSNRTRGWERGVPILFIHGHNGRGPLSACWKGGRQVSKKCIEVPCPHEHKARRRGLIKEHVLIVEKVLGRPLPTGVVVHHFDGNTSNNDNLNLVACNDQAYHRMLHGRTRAYLACGNANHRRCWVCQVWDDTQNMVQYGDCFCHQACMKTYREKRKALQC